MCTAKDSLCWESYRYSTGSGLDEDNAKTFFTAAFHFLSRVRGRGRGRTSGGREVVEVVKWCRARLQAVSWSNLRVSSQFEGVSSYIIVSLVPSPRGLVPAPRCGLVSAPATNQPIMATLPASQASHSTDDISTATFLFLSQHFFLLASLLSAWPVQSLSPLIKPSFYGVNDGWRCGNNRWCCRLVAGPTRADGRSPPRSASFPTFLTLWRAAGRLAGIPGCPPVWRDNAAMKYVLGRGEPGIHVSSPTPPTARERVACSLLLIRSYFRVRVGLAAAAAPRPTPVSISTSAHSCCLLLQLMLRLFWPGDSGVELGRLWWCGSDLAQADSGTFLVVLGGQAGTGAAVWPPSRFAGE